MLHLLSCSTPKECIIDGDGRHTRITGPDAQVTIQGLIFRGASKSAIRISADSPMLHTIKECEFHGTTDRLMGGEAACGPKG